MSTPDTAIAAPAPEPDDDHRLLVFENPYFVCRSCGTPTPAWHQPAKCGPRPRCDQPAFNHPCGCLGVVNTCPTWRRDRGCRCEELRGSVPHGPAAEMGAAL